MVVCDYSMCFTYFGRLAGFVVYLGMAFVDNWVVGKEEVCNWHELIFLFCITLHDCIPFPYSVTKSKLIPVKSG